MRNRNTFVQPRKVQEYRQEKRNPLTSCQVFSHDDIVRVKTICNPMYVCITKVGLEKKI